MDNRELPVVSRTVYRVPASHTDCTLRSFDWSGHKKKRQELSRYLKLMAQDDDKPAPNIIMTGPAGVGKSHLAVALYRWAVLQTDASRSCLLQMSEFCDRVKSTYDDDVVDDPWAEVREADYFLAVDDAFGRRLTDHEIQHILYRLVDTSYRNGASLILTTNYTPEEMQNSLDAHVWSRIRQRSRHWRFEGADRRETTW